MKSIKYPRYYFQDNSISEFSVYEYSLLKFGSDEVARKFGRDVATGFFETHADTLLANRCVVIPSPYNYVPNAATIMTKYFVNRLNELLVDRSGRHVEYITIPRKVSYISDYGFLSAEKRKGLLDGDEFYLPREFLQGKFLIFVDDCCITGNHENKLVEILENHGVMNDRAFVYYAKYSGSDPTIESRINFAAVKSPLDFAEIANLKEHHTIVRPIKYVLGLKNAKDVLDRLSIEKVKEIYSGCLGEGYYKIPDYQENFGLIRDIVQRS